jgi:hypothetical protein
MALGQEQRWVAAKIDSRMQKLLRDGKDNMAIMAAMADHMPAFHQLLSVVRDDEMRELTRKFPGFYRYAKIIESLASGIQSGAIPVPGGRQKPPGQAKTGHRQRAEAMDVRMRQLAEEGVPRSWIIDRMTGHVVDLGTIWNTTTDDELAALCREYPGFRAYAELMEEAAIAEKQKPERSYEGLPPLPAAVKESFSSLLGIAAKLERDYQSMFDALGAAAPDSWFLQPLSQLHAQWKTDLIHFRAAIQDAGIPQASCDIILPMLERMAQRIDKLQARGQAS